MSVWLLGHPWDEGECLVCKAGCGQEDWGLHSWLGSVPHVFVCLLKSIPFFILLCILSFLAVHWFSHEFLYSYVFMGSLTPLSVLISLLNPHSYVFTEHLLCCQRCCSDTTFRKLSFLGQKGSLPQGAFLPTGVADPSPIVHNPRPVGLSHRGKPWMIPVSLHLFEELLGAQRHWEVQ